MNISEVKLKIPKDANLVEYMFSKQKHLMELYGLKPVDLDDPKGQHILREFAWNVTEETGEVLDVIHTTQHQEHIQDEIADSTAFYMELFLLAGFGHKEFLRILRAEEDSHVAKFMQNPPPVPEYAHSRFIESLSLAINSLKNRQWRKTNVLTDQKIFLQKLEKTVPHFLMFVSSVGLNFQNWAEGYLKKYEVNLFRIESKY